jgi:hypothetical protein
MKEVPHRELAPTSPRVRRHERRKGRATTRPPPPFTPPYFLATGGQAAQSPNSDIGGGVSPHGQQPYPLWRWCGPSWIQRHNVAGSRSEGGTPVARVGEASPPAAGESSFRFPAVFGPGRASEAGSTGACVALMLAAWHHGGASRGTGGDGRTSTF